MPELSNKALGGDQRISQGVEFRTRDCALFSEQFRALQQQTGKIVPPRKSVHPASFRTLLPYMSVIEIKEPRIAQVRLIGTAIVNRTHIDNTGRNFMDLLPEGARDWSWNHFHRLLGTPCGCTFLALEEYGEHRFVVEIASFPLSDENGEANYILSLSVEVDRQDLALRGDGAMQIAGLHDYRYLDIGSGT